MAQAVLTRRSKLIRIFQRKLVIQLSKDRPMGSQGKYDAAFLSPRNEIWLLGYSYGMHGNKELTMILSESCK